MKTYIIVMTMLSFIRSVSFLNKKEVSDGMKILGFLLWLGIGIWGVKIIKSLM